MDNVAVTLNTYMSLIFLTPKGTVSSLSGSVSFFSLTANILTPLITSKLKAAEPTIVEAPSFPGHSSIARPVIVSITASKISGALDPRAIKDKLAIVAFQTVTYLVLITSFVFSSFISTIFFVAVILSIEVMKISEMIFIPKNM